MEDDQNQIKIDDIPIELYDETQNFSLLKCCQNLNKKEKIYFSIQLSLLLLFTSIEFIVGYLKKSQTLIADSFHMASDLAACLIFLITRNLSRSKTKSRYSYGTERLEYIGSLIGSIFLLSLCFNIIITNLSLISRFLIKLSRKATAEENLFDDFIDVSGGPILFIVGSIGLLINLVSFALTKFLIDKNHEIKTEQIPNYFSHDDQNRIDSFANQKINQKSTEIIRTENKSTNKSIKSDPGILNTYAMVLHIINDLIGSILVIIISLIIKFGCKSRKCYLKLLDPISSISFTSFLIYLSQKIIRESSSILSQNSNNAILQGLDIKIFNELGLRITLFRVWDLVPGKTFGSLHFQSNADNVIKEKESIKHFLKKLDPDCEITLEPEFKIER